MRRPTTYEGFGLTRNAAGTTAAPSARAVSLRVPPGLATAANRASWAVLVLGTGLAAGAIGGSGRTELVAAAALAIVAFLFVLTAPVGLIILTWCIGALVSPSNLPRLATISGVELYLGDLLLVVSAIAALRHLARKRRSAPIYGAPVVLTASIVALGLVTSDVSGRLSLLRVFLPVIAGLVIGLALPGGDDLWRVARWVFPALIITVPLVGGMSTPRWSGLAGGSNETALIAAITLVLGVAQRSRAAKVLLLSIGLAGLIGAKGITALLAALVGIAVLRRAHASRWASHLARFARSVPVAVLAAAALLLIPVVRPDVLTTVREHVRQAAGFSQAYGNQGNLLVGTSWSKEDDRAFADTAVKGLHNTYLDITLFLGLFGILLFLLLLYAVIWRADALTRAVACVVAVWFNTIGAFPGPGWGVLGLVIGATLAERTYAARARRTAAAGGSAWEFSGLGHHEELPVARDRNRRAGILDHVAPAGRPIPLSKGT
ncbi:hypothetical protein [Micromonospora sp. NPDC003776]